MTNPEMWVAGFVPAIEWVGGTDLAEEHVFEGVQRARVLEVVERFIRLV